MFRDCICLGSTSPLRYALLPSPSLWIVLLHTTHWLCPANMLLWPSSCPSSQELARTRMRTHPQHCLSLNGHSQSWIPKLAFVADDSTDPSQDSYPDVSQSQPWGRRESNLRSHVIDECSTNASTQLASRWRPVSSSYKQRP